MLRGTAFVAAMLAATAFAQTDEQKAKYSGWQTYAGVYRYSWDPIEIKSDGYTLTLMHLTGTYILGENGEELEAELRSESYGGFGRRPDNGPVLISNTHGSNVAELLDNYFIYSSEQNAMPMELYDQGFDVYVTCTRGSDYCLEHDTYDNMSAEFWDFDLVDDAADDYYAAMKYIFDTTTKKVSFVAQQSAAAPMFTGLIANEARFTDVMGKFAALEPCSLSGDAPEPLINSKISKVYADQSIPEVFGPSNHLAWEKIAQQLGRTDALTAWTQVLQGMKSGIPTKTLMHWGENKQAGVFQKWSDDFMDVSKWDEKTEAYDFSAIHQIPVGVFAPSSTHACGATDSKDIAAAVSSTSFFKTYDTDNMTHYAEQTFYDDLVEFLTPSTPASFTQ